MALPKITGFIIGLLIIAFFATSFTYILANISGKYSLSYDNSTLEGYDKLAEVNKDMEEIQSNINLSLDASWTDIIGGYLKSGYTGMKTSLKSFSVFNSMAESAITSSNLGSEGNYIDSNIAANLKTTLITIVLVLLFVGVAIGILVNREQM